MGCAESILSEMAAKSNHQTARPKNQAKVSPAMVRSDKHNVEDARERRRRVISERQAKSQAMAQTISENAMIEKEKMSNSTWRSWKSGCHSDVLSPGVSISVRGSDGTASLDNYPDPAVAYRDDVRHEERSPLDDQLVDVNANKMQISSVLLPNQVAEVDKETTNERVNGTELRDQDLPVKEEEVENEKDSGEEEIDRMEKRLSEEQTSKSEEDSSEQKEQKNSSRTLKELNNEKVNNGPHDHDKDSSKDELRKEDKAMVEISKPDKKMKKNLLRKEDNAVEETQSKTETSKKGKKAKRKLHKEVTFIDQVVDSGESLDTERKTTSQGR